jgi:uncharacterized protein YutE (UPF0331/DUF86 family)
MCCLPSKKFTNYWEVDDHRIIEYARKDLDDFREMLQAIWKFLGVEG